MLRAVTYEFKLSRWVPARYIDNILASTLLLGPQVRLFGLGSSWAVSIRVEKVSMFERFLCLRYSSIHVHFFSIAAAICDSAKEPMDSSASSGVPP